MLQSRVDVSEFPMGLLIGVAMGIVVGLYVVPAVLVMTDMVVGAMVAVALRFSEPSLPDTFIRPQPESTIAEVFQKAA
jgi:hypothetical protein